MTERSVWWRDHVIDDDEVEHDTAEEQREHARLFALDAEMIERYRVAEAAKPGGCSFCRGQPVYSAAEWLDGKPRPPAACPRCGRTITEQTMEEAA